MKDLKIISPSPSPAKENLQVEIIQNPDEFKLNTHRDQAPQNLFEELDSLSQSFIAMPNSVGNSNSFQEE